MKVLIASVALLAIVSTTAAIRCFVCNSAEDSACTDELKKDSPALQLAFVEECPPSNDTETEPFCRKVKEYIDLNTNSSVRVHRECAYKLRNDYECYQKRAEDYVMDVCQCNKDLCNSAPALTSPMATVLAVALPLFARFM